jgi:methyltransferase-like protein 6
VYACDFSPVAIQHLKTNPLYDESYCKAFECDLTRDELTLTIPSMSVDFVLLIFVLSAINPDKMATVVLNIHKVLKTGGLVFFRDYGRYDHAMLRFSKGHKISDNFYFRQDGTRGYYFSEDEVYNMFNSNGYEVVENEYIERETVNHKEGIVAKRIFIQGKFRKMYKN